MELVPCTSKKSKRNPGWKRPEDWKYEEDWNSPAWRERLAEVEKGIGRRLEKFGFEKCPKCETQHTAKTVFCRNCSYKPEMDEANAGG